MRRHVRILIILIAYLAASFTSGCVFAQQVEGLRSNNVVIGGFAAVAGAFRQW